MDTKYQSGSWPLASAITAVVGSEGTLIPSGTTTEDTVLTLSGIGAASSVVFIFDNGTLLTPASLTINGTWTYAETVVAGRHALPFAASCGFG